jgi:hypothetical protein
MARRDESRGAHPVAENPTSGEETTGQRRPYPGWLTRGVGVDPWARMAVASGERRGVHLAFSMADF